VCSSIAEATVPLNHLDRRRPSTILLAFFIGAACTPWMLLAVTYGLEFSAVDRCLDSGGSFDYGRMVCDHSQNHPYVPFVQRRKAFVRSMGSIGAVSILAVAAFVLRGRKPRS
jgi:hypothetical protein